MPYQPRSGQPYGDIFTAATPSLDRTSALLYQEQKQREAKADAENQQLDANMQKEFAKVRSADIPDVIKGYNEYKGLKKQLLFDKDLQKDPLKYAAVQQKSNEALAKTFSTINGSQEFKGTLQGMTSGHQTHPDNYDDNFGTLVGTAQNTPLSQLKTHKLGDLSNPDTYSYKGTNTDFQKIAATAAGQPKPVYQSETPVDAAGLQTKITPYLYPNSPAQYFQSYMGSLAQHKAGKDASVAWDAIPQSQKDYVDQHYAAIPSDKWQKMTGQPTPQQLIPSDPNSKAEQFAIFQAKLHAISNEPKEGAPVFKTNEAKKFQMETDRQTKMKEIEHANAKDLIDYKKKIDPNDAELNNLWVDKYIQGLKENSSGTPTRKTVQNGKSVYENDIPLDPTLASSLQKGGITPLSLSKMSDGRFRINYPVKDKEGNPVKLSSGANAGNYAVDESLSVPITEQQLGVALGKKNATGKARGKEILNVMNQGGKPSSPPVKQEDAAKKAEELLKKYMK